MKAVKNSKQKKVMIILSKKKILILKISDLNIAKENRINKITLILIIMFPAIKLKGKSASIRFK